MTGRVVSSPSAWLRRVVLSIGMLALCATLSGCATANQDDSDLPWNTPQPWEGSPMIPGLESR